VENENSNHREQEQNTMSPKAAQRANTNHVPSKLLCMKPFQFFQMQYLIMQILYTFKEL
jgi:hypothetical protein